MVPQSSQRRKFAGLAGCWAFGAAPSSRGSKRQLYCCCLFHFLGSKTSHCSPAASSNSGSASHAHRIAPPKTNGTAKGTGAPKMGRWFRGYEVASSKGVMHGVYLWSNGGDGATVAGGLGLGVRDPVDAIPPPISARLCAHALMKVMRPRSTELCFASVDLLRR